MRNVLKYKSSSKIFDVVNTILLLVIAIIMLYPLIYVFSASFSSSAAINSGKVILFPVDFNIKGYEFAFMNKDILIGYRNTIIYTVFGTLINLAVTLPAAYALSRKGLFTRNVIMIFFMITMYISGGIIPTYLNFKSFHMLNTPWIMLINGAVSVYNLIVARTFFASTIPEEIIEAAKVDGCMDFGVFFKIVIPLSKPIIMVMCLFYGVGHWNEYFNAMIYLDARSLMSLQVFLREILIQGEMLKSLSMDPSISAETLQMLSEQAKAMELIKYCVIVIAAAPMLAIYPRLQKFFEKGVMIGSVKG